MITRIIAAILCSAAIAVAIASVNPVCASAATLNTIAIDAAFGRGGQMLAGEVYKVGFPRTDLHITVGGIDVKPALALGSYAVFKEYPSGTLMMGDLVLLAAEVQPVMQSLQSNGIEITALHNHLLDASPMVFYMHYVGMGDAGKLAASLKRALAQSATPLGPAMATAASQEAVWFQSQLEASLGHSGKVTGGVLNISVARAIDETMDGLTIPPAMGTAMVMNFQDAGGHHIATTGDFALTADEVSAVTKALRDHHIDIEALHMHMLDDVPRLFYLHWWAVGDPASISAGLKAALEHIRTR